MAVPKYIYIWSISIDIYGSLIRILKLTSVQSWATDVESVNSKEPRQILTKTANLENKESRNSTWDSIGSKALEEDN